MAEQLRRLAADALQVLHKCDVVNGDTGDEFEPVAVVAFTTKQQIKTTICTHHPVSHSLVYVLLVASQSIVDDVTNASATALWLLK